MAGALALALAIFLIGIKRYRKQAPVGSPFTKVAQVFVAAARKWRVSETHGGGRSIYHGHEPDDDDERIDTHIFAQFKRTIARTNQLRYVSHVKFLRFSSQLMFNSFYINQCQISVKLLWLKHLGVL